MHRGALVGLHAVGLEVLRERDAVDTGDPLGDRQVGGVEARGHDDRVDRPCGAVPGDDARGVEPGDRSVTSSTLSRASAGYHVLEIRIRLHPIRKSGVTLRRSSGSVMPLRMLPSAIRLAGSASRGARVNAGT